LWVNQEIITINGKLGPKISRMHTAFFHTSTTTPKNFHTIWRWSYYTSTRRISFSHEVIWTSQREQCSNVCWAYAWQTFLESLQKFSTTSRS
jgi:hypothetical protein